MVHPRHPLCLSELAGQGHAVPQYHSTAVPQYRSCLEIPHYSWCPDCMGEGQLFQPLIPSFLAGGGLLENIQLLTIQLMYTLAGDCE